MNGIRSNEAPNELISPRRETPVLIPEFLRQNGVLRLTRSGPVLKLDSDFFFELAPGKSSEDRLSELIGFMRFFVSTREFYEITISSEFLNLIPSHGEIELLFQVLFCKHLRIGSQDSWANTFPYRSLNDLPVESLQSLELHGVQLRDQLDLHCLKEKIALAAALNAEHLRLDLSLMEDLCHENSLDCLFGACMMFKTVDLSAVTHRKIDGLCLISRTALQAFLLNAATKELFLRGVGLNDLHVHTMTNAMYSLDKLVLEDQCFSEDGYAKIYQQLCSDSSISVSVDSSVWNGRFKLIRKMKAYGRDKFTSSAGNFRNKREWVEWLIRLSNCRQDHSALMFWLSFEDTGALYQTIRDSPDFLSK